MTAVIPYPLATRRVSVKLPQPQQLHEAMNPPGSAPAQRAMRKLMLEALRKEVDDDDA